MSHSLYRIRRHRAGPARRRGVRSAESRSEDVLDAIRRWSERYGEPPTLADWEPSRARARDQEWRIDRFAEGDWPTTRVVRYHFGTLNAAVREAGYTPRPRGHRARRLPVDREPVRAVDVTASTVVLRIRAVGEARREADRAALIYALRDLSPACLNWADRLAA
jgi:hypothetical protein